MYVCMPSNIPWSRQWRQWESRIREWGFRCRERVLMTSGAPWRAPRAACSDPLLEPWFPTIYMNLQSNGLLKSDYFIIKTCAIHRFIRIRIHIHIHIHTFSSSVCRAWAAAVSVFVASLCWATSWAFMASMRTRSDSIYDICGEWCMYANIHTYTHLVLVSCDRSIIVAFDDVQRTDHRLGGYDDYDFIEETQYFNFSPIMLI